MTTATRTVLAASAPVASGLSARWTSRSRRRSTRSFDQPIDSWPVKTAAVTSTTRPAGSPASTASSAVRAVTAAVGSG